jgi:hypothetical protein
LASCSSCLNLYLKSLLSRRRRETRETLSNRDESGNGNGNTNDNGNGNDVELAALRAGA